MKKVFVCLTFFLFHTSVFADQVCEADGTCTNNLCEDLDVDCQFWAESGECDKNPVYMKKRCPKSCNSCDQVARETQAKVDAENKPKDEYGVVQVVEGTQSKEIVVAIDEMKAYMRKAQEDPGTTSKMRELLDNCKIQHELCAFWKVIGECEKNPGYMKLMCAPICHTCEYLSVEFRCPVDPDAPIAWKPGDLHQFFVNITTLPEFATFEPHVLSRPDYVNGDTKATADYQIGPWVVTLDKFVTNEEADRLIQLGAEEGYERSSDVGKMKFDGTFEDNINNGRTSLNAWCQYSCYNDTLAKQVMARIEATTNIPEVNSEYLQLLKYDVGQFYQQHHDYIPFQVDRQPGVRILTVFLYLNDVEEGGGTNFPLLDLTVMPKKGRALIWPSVLDSDPNRKDGRTDHQALPVTKGIKYGANAWVHQRDFKTPNSNNHMAAILAFFQISIDFPFRFVINESLIISIAASPITLLRSV